MKIFKSGINKIIIASFGSVFSLYLELTTSFILLTYHWNSSYQLPALYTTMYAFILVFINPILSAYIDKCRAPYLYLSFFSFLAGILSIVQFTFDNVIIFFMALFFKNILRLFISPSVIYELRCGSLTNISKEISNYQFLCQVCKLLAPLYIAVFVCFYEVRYSLLTISAFYFLSLFLFVFHGVQNKRLMVIEQDSFNNNLKIKDITKKRNIKIFMFITTCSIFVYAFDSFVAYQIRMLNLPSSMYSVFIAIAGMAGLIVTRNIYQGKVKANEKNISLSFMFWGGGYLSLGAISFISTNLFVTTIYLIISFIIIGAACAANSVLLLIFFQSSVSKEKTASALAKLNLAVGIAMFIGPSIGLFAMHFISLKWCYLIIGGLVVSLSLIHYATSIDSEASS